MVEFDYLAAVSLVVSFISLSLVLFQLRDHLEQRKIDALIRLKDINRQLISLGFTTPQLFDVLRDQDADPAFESRYNQLWFNQYELIHVLHGRGFLSPELQKSLEDDIRNSLQKKNMQRHWRENRQYYTPSFQNFVNVLLPPDVQLPAQPSS